MAAVTLRKVQCNFETLCPAGSLVGVATTPSRWGEMNAIPIQKVEELTLYILDLQKQIDELKNLTKGD